MIPQIGFGVYLSPPETCVASCKKAFSAGYRHIDTAQYYENETEVGRAVADSKIPREEVYITTKILFAGDDAASTYQKLTESVDKLVGKDGYVDLFLIHSPNFGEGPRKLMWQALEKLKEEGKTRDIGVSNYGIGHIAEIKSISTSKQGWPPAVNQIEVCLQQYSNCFHGKANPVCTAPSLVPTARSRQILPGQQYRRRSVLPARSE